MVYLPYNESTTAEDICISICKDLGIGTVARHLFALRIHRKQTYLANAATFCLKSPAYEFRVRFKVHNIFRLKKIDIKAYDYYFHQVRTDVLENRIPDLVYEKYKRELVGLGVTDMYRVMLEKDIPSEVVETDYKKYIPREVIKRHTFFIKKPIRDTLGKIKRAGHDAWYVKAEYLKQVETMAPEYLSEEYKAFTDLDGIVSALIVKVSPHMRTAPGIKYCHESKRDNYWIHICTFDELGFVSIRKDGTVEISRKNGIPFYLKFLSLPSMFSFVSLLDGYYRLSYKWTFNICKETPAPSLQRLYNMRCHGPVGGEFSYAKLEEKCDNKAGCFILRESESKYNTFFIDVCTKNSLKPKTFKLERLPNTDYIFNDDPRRFPSISQLVTAYNDPEGAIYLAECVPPSEYDKSPLLLCKRENQPGDAVTDGSFADTSLPHSPICIHTKDLQVYKGQKKEGTVGITIVYRSMWRHAKGKKVEAAMKILKNEHRDKYLKDFMDLAGQWACLQSTFIVRLYGVTLMSQISMVLEYVRFGPLDRYLRDNKAKIKLVDLIEASSNLASALWHLEENRIVHGKIRCRKLLVSNHDESSFIVKLSDGGIHTTYTTQEVHWIPIECYSNLEHAKKSPQADVWAYGTTLWEIFTHGESMNQMDHLETMRLYTNGKRLTQPAACPNDIYQMMRECWEADPHRRRQPQSIMRDINQIMYQVYNSRRTHAYAKLKHVEDHSPQQQMAGVASTTSTTSLFSNTTESTCLGYQDELLSMTTMSEVDSDLSSTSSFGEIGASFGRGWISHSDDLLNQEDTLSCDFSNILSNFHFSNNTATTSLDSINSMQSIFELDDDCNVILQGRIGQGFYGEVYKGSLEHIGDKEAEPKLVAIKKLKKAAMASCISDFEREISIMKGLKHPNIVEILGVLQEPEVSLVMEFVHHGSLQSYLKIYRETLTIKQLLNYALDIAKGMEYLGEKNIVHRDLAARNILVVDENHVKISDFGLAQVIGSNDYYILKTNRELPIKWYALESLRDGKFSPRSDVWSYGVTMCEMFSYGEEPVLPIMQEKVEGQEQQILLNALESGARFPCPPVCPQSVYVRIIYPCWLVDPHTRLTFTQLCAEIIDLLLQY